MKYSGAIIAMLLLLAGCERRAEFPIASVNAIPPTFAAKDWQYVDTLGNTAGPFKALGDHVLNVGPNKSVWYRAGGARVEENLDLQEEVLIRRFENQQGDSLLIVYKRRQGG